MALLHFNVNPREAGTARRRPSKPTGNLSLDAVPWLCSPPVSPGKPGAVPDDDIHKANYDNLLPFGQFLPKKLSAGKADPAISADGTGRGVMVGAPRGRTGSGGNGGENVTQALGGLP